MDLVMNNEFSLFSLGEVADVIAGGDKPKAFSPNKNDCNNIPVFANAEKKDGLQGYTDTPRIIEPAVTMAARGSNVGFVAVRKEPYFPIVRLLSLIPKKERLDVDYLFYNLKQNRQSGTGSGQPQITIPQISGRSISLPPLLTQQKIGKVLSSLDAKIELNNKMNAELEAMGKLIYDYWFVQFDFPDVNGKPYKSSGGKMIYNEELKREIPDSWAVNLLADWFDTDKTGDWGKETEQGNYTVQVDCIRGADINGLNGKGKVKAPNRFILQKNQHKLLLPYDLIIEISGGSPTQSTGRMAFLTPEIFDRFSHPMICSNFCKAISLKNKGYFYNFVYQWNAIYDNGILFGWEGKTSGIKNLLFDSFINNHNVCVPPESLAKQFSKVIEPIQQKKQKSLKENSELEKLRDWLLPMLMNGQVTVKYV